jgi:hypothetical protein
VGKIAIWASAILLVLALIAFFLTNVYLDRFLKRRIASTFEKAYPEYSIHIAGLQYKIRTNQLECDSVTALKTDSSVSCSISRLSLSGISRIRLLLAGGVVAPEDLECADVHAKGITVKFPRSLYELHCERLSVSMPDSEIVIHMLKLHPSGDDEQFFEGSVFRRTRYRLLIPQCTVKGSACLSIFEGNVGHARTAHIQNASIDILINKEKSSPPDSTHSVIQDEFLSSVTNIIRLNTLDVSNARLEYGERFAVRGKPAVLTFDGLGGTAEWPSNSLRHSEPVVVRAEGTFMSTAAVKVLVSIQAASRDFTFHYSGSLGRIDLERLNPFLEIAEHKRLKTGVLYDADFDIQVIAGSARGTVRASYKDLKVVEIDKDTGSESGIIKSIVSFFYNNIKFRTTNMPDDSGSMKIGRVSYNSKSGDTFLEVAWFALRSGIGDIVGF